MTVTHLFVSGKADGGDATLVQPGNWNAAHVIAAATITLAQIVNVSATQRVIGRNTAGAGVEEEVTASQLFDWVSGTNGVLLTRAAGTWGAATNVGIDGGDLNLVTNATPTTPPSNTVKLSGLTQGGRAMLSLVTPDGEIVPVQPSNSRLANGMWTPLGANQTTIQATGMATPTQATSATVTGRAHANTTLFTSTRRVASVSAAGAGSCAGFRETVGRFWRGNAARAGGFHWVGKFANSDAVIVATGRSFFGLQNSTGAPADVDPSTLINLVGVGNDNGDTQMQLYASGAVAQARTALGANFPANTVSVDVYELAIYCPPNGSRIDWSLLRMNTGHFTSGSISAGANLMANTLFLNTQMWRGNGGTGTAVGIDMLSVYYDLDV